MPLAPSALRARIATAINTDLAADGWTESRYAYPLFPGQDSRLIVHLGYAVGLISTTPVRPDRQAQSFGAVVQTTVGVRFAHRLRADAMVADYDAALDAEGDLLISVMGSSQTDGQVVLQGVTTRDVVADGTLYLGEIRFTVLHTYAIA